MKVIQVISVSKSGTLNYKKPKSFQMWQSRCAYWPLANFGLVVLDDSLLVMYGWADEDEANRENPGVDNHLKSHELLPVHMPPMSVYIFPIFYVYSKCSLECLPWMGRRLIQFYFRVGLVFASYMYIYSLLGLILWNIFTHLQDFNCGRAGANEYTCLEIRIFMEKKGLVG